MVFGTYFTGLRGTPLGMALASRDATMYFMRFLFFMGLRTPPQRFKVIYVLWAIVLNLLSAIYQPISFGASYFAFMSEFAAAELLTSLQVCASTFASSAKLILFSRKVSYLDRANDLLDELDTRCTGDDEKLKIRSTIGTCNRIQCTVMFSFSFYTTLTFLTNLAQGRPPFQLYYPMLDWRADKLQMYVQAFIEYFIMMGACLQNAAVDSYPLIYTLLLRLHIDMLTERVRALGSDAQLSDDENYVQLCNCIKVHKLILDYCDEIRPVIGVTVFVQFLAMGLVMGLTLMNVVLFSNLTASLGAASFLIAILLETTPLCGVCSYIIDDCEKLADAVANSNWINAEQRYKKTLLIFLHKVQQPITFEAFNVPITIASNISIMKFSFSVFTFFKEMNITERLQKKK